MNTDGAEKFKCNSWSAWPVFLKILELPIDARMAHLITCGIWIGQSKPNLPAFIGSFVDNICSKLVQIGDECQIQNETRNLKLYIIGSVADAVARAPVQGTMQFNAGKFLSHLIFFTFSRNFIGLDE